MQIYFHVAAGSGSFSMVYECKVGFRNLPAGVKAISGYKKYPSENVKQSIFPKLKSSFQKHCTDCIENILPGPEILPGGTITCRCSSASFVATAESGEIYQLPQRWREMARAFGTPLWSKPFELRWFSGAWNEDCSGVMPGCGSCADTQLGWGHGRGLVQHRKTQSAGEMAPNGANREWILLPKFDCHRFGNRTCEWTPNRWYHTTKKCDRIVQKEKIEFHRPCV